MYMIENQSENVYIKYRQADEKILEFCDSFQSNRFAWDNLYKKHQIEAEILYKEANNSKPLVCSIKLDEMEQNEEIFFRLMHSNGNEEKVTLYYYTYTDGYTKKLIFDDKRREKQDKEVEDHTPELMLNIELGGMGISLICDGNNENIDMRREILFCSIVDIHGICIEFKTETRLQLRIGVMQIDNQIAIDTPFPVTLFNENVKINKEEDIKDIKPFFNLNLVISKDVPEVLYFKKVEFLIQKIILQ